MIWNVTTRRIAKPTFVAWERETIRAKYGINFGIEYTHTTGVAELSDYEWYFSGFIARRRPGDREAGSAPKSGETVIYFPRRAYDMWNTRYFVVPAFANGWRDERWPRPRSDLRAELILSRKGPLRRATWQERVERVARHPGFRASTQRARNFLAPGWCTEPGRSNRPGALARASSSEPDRDPLLRGPVLERSVNNVIRPPRSGMGERSRPGRRSAEALGRTPGHERIGHRPLSEPATRHPGRHAQFTGLVILADVNYPGWQLTIDDQPAPIYSGERLDARCAVSAGPHRLVYSFSPRSFQLGLIGSIVGLVAWLSLGLFCVFRPTHRLLAD